MKSISTIVFTTEATFFFPPLHAKARILFQRRKKKIPDSERAVGLLCPIGDAVNGRVCYLVLPEQVGAIYGYTSVLESRKK